MSCGPSLHMEATLTLYPASQGLDMPVLLFASQQIAILRFDLELQRYVYWYG